MFRDSLSPPQTLRKLPGSVGDPGKCIEVLTAHKPNGNKLKYAADPCRHLDISIALGMQPAKIQQINERKAAGRPKNNSNKCGDAKKPENRVIEQRYVEATRSKN